MAWIEHRVPQCGYCQAGQIMNAASFWRRNPNPSAAEVDRAMQGNICRCGTYKRVRAAILSAAAATEELNHEPHQSEPTRIFCRLTGMAAGGLALGVSFPAAPSPWRRSATEINAFVHIAENGDTTIYCGRCEMGQGIATALPAAVADELEADWQRVRVLQGDADAKYGPQATGGSRSINVMFEPMRQAGAAAKTMLVAAAAERWGLPVDECYAEQHRVFNRQNQRSLGYGELAQPRPLCRCPSSHRSRPRTSFAISASRYPGTTCRGGHRQPGVRCRYARTGHEVRCHPARAGYGWQA